MSATLNIRPSTGATSVTDTGTTSRPGRRRGRLGVLAAVSLLALTLGACSSGSGPEVASAGGGVGTPSAEETLSFEEKQVKFTSCMRENGVDMPDADENGMMLAGEAVAADSITSAEMEAADKAFEACKEFMPDGGDLPPMSPEDLEASRAYAECMRENGVDMPDPDPESGGTMLTLDDLDMDAFETAQKACGDKLPGGGLSAATTVTR